MKGHITNNNIDFVKKFYSKIKEAGINISKQDLKQIIKIYHELIKEELKYGSGGFKMSGIGTFTVNIRKGYKTKAPSRSGKNDKMIIIPDSKTLSFSTEAGFKKELKKI